MVGWLVASGVGLGTATHTRLGTMSARTTNHFMRRRANLDTRGYGGGGSGMVLCGVNSN